MPATGTNLISNSSRAYSSNTDKLNTKVLAIGMSDVYGFCDSWKDTLTLEHKLRVEQPVEKARIHT